MLMENIVLNTLTIYIKIMSISEFCFAQTVHEINCPFPITEVPHKLTFSHMLFSGSIIPQEVVNFPDFAFKAQLV